MGFMDRLNKLADDAMAREATAKGLKAIEEREAARKRRLQHLKEQPKIAREQQRLDQSEAGDRVRARISSVGDRSTGTLACPKCGGTSFKAKRSRGAKIAAAPMLITLAAVKKTRVKCETCGTEYVRG